jgi:hypothetical protein
MDYTTPIPFYISNFELNKAGVNMYKLKGLKLAAQR